jgi:hypothetical protein
MLRYRYLYGTALVVAATAAIAAPFSSIWLATVKTTREVLNFYPSDKPVGGENAVPTVFVFSSDKVSYSHVGAGQVKTTLNVRFRQVCAGDGWKQYRLPHVYVGDQQWPQPGDGKPILKPDTALYEATLKVASNQLELNPNLDPVKRCNAVVIAHTFGGKPPADLLKNGFWIRTEEGVRAKLTPGCSKPSKCVGFCEDTYAGQESFWLPVWINCLPTGYVETHRLPPEPHRTKPEAHRLPGVFRSIELEAVNSPLNHICPATVVFRGKIQSNQAIKGSYRFVGSDGYATPSYPFSLPDNGEQSVSRQRRVELPAATGGLAAAGGGTWPRPVNGWLQLEVMQGPGTQPMRSAKASYRVNCLKPPAPGERLR